MNLCFSLNPDFASFCSEIFGPNCSLIFSNSSELKFSLLKRPSYLTEYSIPSNTKVEGPWTDKPVIFFVFKNTDCSPCCKDSISSLSRGLVTFFKSISLSIVSGFLIVNMSVTFLNL